ncbi:P-loop NTPase family protein [Varunaivibrio sulfuroxidans]|uniref:Adenylate kinase family enzyme n=1 Tax=Varunaivibrio sulfuroxidans TaxID=1773489 RepID=A0A4R3JE46_9PROT|nr:shikimate kinase [Varunaivibrio sulfuroxidans]TCS64328.1 hypothetical protein EDD55_102371 [Varunaivibrio sulfuroxidans]WES31235.1 hypothetical protein P3M64_02350 [Varunaivibrio sulfuroxidans]
MQKIVIFGNAGSGKTTLARHYANHYGLARLDLDTLAWTDATPPSRKALCDSAEEIETFIAQNRKWVIEGVYAGLLGVAIVRADQLFFMNPGVEACVANCKSRPWEPHKYKSAAQQDKNLAMLIEWVRRYPNRRDEYSLAAHRALFDSFTGEKKEVTRNDENLPSPRSAFKSLTVR